jgi:hypothetical protein
MKSLHRVRRSEDDRERRLRGGGYVEAQATLAKAYEAGLERTRAMLAAQRKELARQARMRHGTDT